MSSLQDSKCYLASALIGLLAIALFFLLSRVQPQFDPDEVLGFSDCDFQVISKSQQFVATYRQCLLNQVRATDKKIWEALPTAVGSCLAREDFWKGWGIRRIGKPSSWNAKYVSYPQPANSGCNVVLIRQNSPLFDGDSPERKLLDRVPDCRFHILADRNDTRSTVKPQPKFYNKRLAFVENGDEAMWAPIMGKDAAKDVHIYHGNVKMKTFLEKHVKLPRIDYLWIDEIYHLTKMESGFEVVPLPACYFEYSVLKDPSNVTVCQVTFVNRIFENGDRDYDTSVHISCKPIFNDLIVSLISNSKFLPFRSKFSDGLFYQMYINVGHPYCLKKYLTSKQCVGEDSTELSEV